MKKKIIFFVTLFILLTFVSTVFADYTRRADNTVPAYKNEALTQRTGNERVDAGDVVTVHRETNRAYYVTYPVKNGKKTRWVPKNIFNASQPAPTAHNPEGNFDGVVSNSPNQITVTGWAADRDNMGASLQIHVYVGGGAGSGAEGYAITANKSRPDVHNWFANQGVPAGEFYGFNETINVKRTGNQPVYVYAINVGSGDNVELGHKSVNINSLKMGDVNGDGKVDRTDSNLALDLHFEGKCHPAADFDGDGRITAADLSSIRNLINNNVQEKEGWIKTNGANVYFRSGASTSASAIGKIANGSQIMVLEYNNPNGWSRISYNGSTGYVASQYVSFENVVINGRQQAMVNKARQYLGSNDYNGYCQKFVRVVGQGIGLPAGNAASALDACNKWRVSTDKNIPIGAAVYLRGRNKSTNGYKYGHVGIYAGNGQVIHALTTVKEQTLDSLLKSFDYLGWGWQSGVDLR